MKDEENESAENNSPENGESDEPKVRRPIFSRRNLLLSGAIAGSLILLAVILGTIAYRTGVTDSYIKGQFVEKMNAIGIVFTADVFRVSINPLQLELRNATFNDRVSGERLFFVRDARIGLTIQDLFAWRLSRDISVDSTEINGAEVWIKFDENGRSNFANLVEDTSTSNLNFRYSSMKFVLRDGTVHFGDLSRKIGADANNVQITLEPESLDVPEDQIRYRVQLNSSGSTFTYDERELRDISVRVTALANSSGAEITDLRIDTPIGNSYLKGSISDWSNFVYNLSIESTVDLTQTTSIFPVGASIGGVGNFNGTVTGSGEKYKVTGVVESQAISAEGVYLRGLNIDGTVEGTNKNYEANGKAIAELLTFEDFKVDMLSLSGNVRGTGSDFRWVGELQAAAARSNAITLGRLFLSDALAEYKDQQFRARATGRTQKLTVGEAEFDQLSAQNLDISARNGGIQLSAPTAFTESFTLDDLKFNNVSGRDLSITDAGQRTEVKIGQLASDRAAIDSIQIRTLRAADFTLVDLPGTTDLKLRNVSADRANLDDAIVEGIAIPVLDIRDNAAETLIYSDLVKVAKLDANAVSLGSLNIAGVRMNIRQGRIQVTSNDIVGGDVQLASMGIAPEGGKLEGLSIAKPVFILEPSGRYRASADMSIGGGLIGTVPLGRAAAKVDVNNDRVALNELAAEVADGDLTGRAEFAIRPGANSVIDGTFSDLDIAKLAAIQSGRVIPVQGRSSGTIDLEFRGTELSTASGRVEARIAATAGNADSGVIPVNGDVSLIAENGLFRINEADLGSSNSNLSATGQIDFAGENSDLALKLTSSDANEIDRMFRLLGISPEAEEYLDEFRVSVAGEMTVDLNVKGNINEPQLNGKGYFASISLRDREIGSVSSDFAVDDIGVQFTNGLLRESGGRQGQIAFDVNVPSAGTDNITVKADLNSIDAGSLIAALPVELPGRIRDFSGTTSGKVNIRGLPNLAAGTAEIYTVDGSIAGERFDRLDLNAAFAGTRIDFSRADIRVGDGTLSAKGFYDRATTQFEADINGSSIPLPLLASILPESSSLPGFGGNVEVVAKANGSTNSPASIAIEFNGTATGVLVNESPFGDVQFRGTTADQIFRAQLDAVLDNKPQRIEATVSLGDDDLPFLIQAAMNDSSLRPFLSLIPQLRTVQIDGTATGRVEFGGNLMQTMPDGTRAFSTQALSGSAVFQQIAFQVQDIPLSSTEPVIVRLTPNALTFESARFAGGGSNVFIAGTKALTDAAENDLSVQGRVNLALLNIIPTVSSTDTFFGGLADLSVRLTGPNSTARLTGVASTENASIAAFLGSERISFDRVRSRILFSSNQAQIEQAEGFLGGGRFTANGGILLTDQLEIDSYRVGINGTNVTVPLPDDFLTTGDARLEITGRRSGRSLINRIGGSIIARRSLYTTDIDLANIVGGRRQGSITGSSGGSVIPTQFDLTIEGRDALVVRNNIADLTASASLRLTGTSASPQLSGRIVANEGTVFFRKDRYIVQRGVLEFPPNTSIDPIISLIAESEIGGYQVFVNLSGSLTDTELLNATVRSSPALPQADVISLITTGSLANTESGIPTLASTGINTAAEVLTDSIINNPARRATDRLFGLNVFEIDPIISGDRVDPTARLTVGRQINNNLRVTYATNLSQDQNQVLALEYRVSNRLSVVAQYEQRSLSNVTRNRDNFSFEVRFRRRF